VISFVPTKVTQTGHNTYEVVGNFTIRGVSIPEKLTLTVSGQVTGSGEIKGTMGFNRKDQGINKGVLSVKTADHVDANFHLAGKQVSGPALALE
jgi:polyisoprenoid-binding protein YceI